MATLFYDYLFHCSSIILCGLSFFPFADGHEIACKCVYVHIDTHLRRAYLSTRRNAPKEFLKGRKSRISGANRKFIGWNEYSLITSIYFIVLNPTFTRSFCLLGWPSTLPISSFIPKEWWKGPFVCIIASSYRRYSIIATLRLVP